MGLFNFIFGKDPAIPLLERQISDLKESLARERMISSFHLNTASQLQAEKLALQAELKETRTEMRSSTRGYEDRFLQLIGIPAVHESQPIENADKPIQYKSRRDELIDEALAQEQKEIDAYEQLFFQEKMSQIRTEVDQKETVNAE